MASGSLICAHKNIFNESILGIDAFYFTNETDIVKILKSERVMNERENKINNNLEKFEQIYNWDTIINQYYNVFIESLK